MLTDFSAAIRTLRNTPSFTFPALVVMAIGFGTATAAFSVADGVALRGLPFDASDRIVAVFEHDTRAADTLGGGLTTAPTFLDWRASQTPFEHLAAVGNASFRTRTSMGEPVEALAQAVTWEFFLLLRTAPILGRAFVPDDETAGRHHVVVLGHAYWRLQFGGAPDVVGRTIELNEERWQIVGVAPAGFTYPVGASRPTDFYVPLAFSEVERSRDSGHAYFYSAIARLKPGVTVAGADREMARLATLLDREHRGWSPGRTARVVTLQERLVGSVRSWMLLLLSAVGLVLLVASVNVAGLMLVRMTVRSRELSVRAALGASRWHLVRGPLAESMVLTLAGAAAGLALAHGTVGVLRAWLPFGLPRVAAVAVDWRVVFVALGVALAVGLTCGLLPGLVATRRGFRVALTEGGRSMTSGSNGSRLRGGLVVVEVALTMLLLVGAGLFGRSFVTLMRVDPGFDPNGVIALAVGAAADPRSLAARSVAGGSEAIEQAIEAVRRVPGVERAGAVAGGLPLSGRWSRSSVELPGRGELQGSDNDIDLRRVSPEYLKVLRVRLLRGRHLAPADRAAVPLVVVVNEAAARKYWPGRDAIGQRITVADRERVVVGVVGNIRHLGPEVLPRQEAYLPLAQERVRSATLVARTTRPPLEVLPAVKAAIRSVPPGQRFASEVTTLDGYMDRLVAQRRFLMALTAMLGALALLIATAGVYGVMSYAVAQQTAEIGLRMALGATPSAVLRRVLRQASVLLGSGLGVGAAAAWMLGSSVRAFLFGVRPDDAGVSVAATCVLAIAGLLASAMPARRAANIDPLVALRHE
jgi:putative ABC transport system permease protein